MAAFRFSRLATEDLMDIARYTMHKWGEEQTIRYIDDLEDCCRRLAGNPEMGRGCDDIRAGLRRMEHGRHVLFYRVDTEGVLISRILHQRYVAGKADH